MKKILLIFITLIFCSCEKRPIEIRKSNNPGFNVEKLFTHDGITVYRFSDGFRNHYFTSTGETITTQYARAGRTSYFYDENIK